MAKCYSGPDPYDTLEDRKAILSWAYKGEVDPKTGIKTGGHIADGASWEKVYDAINKHFYNDAGKPEWIIDKLKGNGTPLRALSDKVYRAQYNRRQIQKHAQELTKGNILPPPLATAKKWTWDLPRNAALTFHDVAFPITHAGDLLMRPESWPIFWRNTAKTWALRGRQLIGKGGENAAITERGWDKVKRDDLFELALHGGVDLSERPHKTDLVNPSKSGDPNTNEMAWQQLKVMRFELWKSKVGDRIEPGMTQEQKLDIAKNMAVWANHATGSAKGGIMKLPWVRDQLFGAKLTQSKLNRLTVDPAQTLKTIGQTVNEHVLNNFMNWEKATPGEKLAAYTRLEGLSQFATTYVVGLLINQGYLSVFGQKDKDGKPLQQINWTNPTRGDWMKFKGFGWELGLPGLHTELKMLGTLLAVTFKQSKEVNPLKESMTKQWGDTLFNWGAAKLNPNWQLGMEIAKGKGFPDRPLPFHMPWYKDAHPKKITPFNAPYKSLPGVPLKGWDEYLFSHGPIILSGPMRYVYDQFRSQGMSAMDTMTFLKALMAFGVGATGAHMGEDYGAAKATAKQNQVARQLGH